MDKILDKTRKSKVRKLLTALVIGAVVGFLVSFAFMRTAQLGILGELDTSREIAGLVGLLYVATACFVGFGVINPKLGARVLNVEDGEELQEQRSMLGWSVAGMAALGFALFIAALSAPVGPIPAEIMIIGVVALLAISCFTSYRQRRYTDELMRNVSLETASTAFYFTSIFGGGWALLAHGNVVAGPLPLDWLTMFAAIMLLATYWVCGKRGLLKQR
ncbi:MAG: hypothetical protein WA957_13470 [Alteraurantiacibacter sp.]